MDALRPTETVPGMGIARVPSFKSGMVWNASYLPCCNKVLADVEDWENCIIMNCNSY
ncbi:MAG: hypothetical protein OSJ55_07265 [Bacteroidales bacterium]|nr:hypothetical protein [Bacteroidales bacterium]